MRKITQSPDQEAYRQLPLPILGRINNGALIFDLRCLEDDNILLGQLPELETAITIE